jgi:hypothetical protein
VFAWFIGSAARLAPRFALEGRDEVGRVAGTPELEMIAAGRRGDDTGSDVVAPCADAVRGTRIGPPVPTPTGRLMGTATRRLFAVWTPGTMRGTTGAEGGRALVEAAAAARSAGAGLTLTVIGGDVMALATFALPSRRDWDVRSAARVDGNGRGGGEAAGAGVGMPPRTGVREPG